MGNRHYRASITNNARFMPKLPRRPKAPRAAKYRYQPSTLTQHPKLARGQLVIITAIPEDKNDLSVEVVVYRTEDETYNVFWNDLRKVGTL